MMVDTEDEAIRYCGCDGHGDTLHGAPRFQGVWTVFGETKAGWVDGCVDDGWMMGGGGWTDINATGKAPNAKC